ncbi:hypothetical protein LCGC14_1743040 [marine sediment metagenome]|uniref:Uncharacterized protein n=1 Tax=marine sediment metagenome TaxID=412755 RepID=A0A0F9HTQ8_9ZZZZ
MNTDIKNMLRHRFDQAEALERRILYLRTCQERLDNWIELESGIDIIITSSRCEISLSSKSSAFDRLPLEETLKTLRDAVTKKLNFVQGVYDEL